jgi:hypothetical protein
MVLINTLRQPEISDLKRPQLIPHEQSPST